MRAILILLSVCTLACDGGKDADLDGDGFGEADDCDDNDGSTYPGAAEVCDGLDNNCDGAIDEDPADGSDYFVDADGDGYGDAANTAVACEAVDGLVEDSSDCDDADSAVNPGAEELCATAGVDDNCNGEVDEDTAADASSWYADGDSDGFGADGQAVQSCAQPTGYAAVAGDCDDTLAYVHPGAAELCDGIDGDCDPAVTDEGTVTFWSGGVATDMTAALSGAEGAPAAYTLTTDGDLSFCEGTHYVNLVAEANVNISSRSGDPGSTVLDGGGEGAIVDVVAEGVDVSVSGLTLQNGAGSDSIAYEKEVKIPGGGALVCITFKDPSTLTVDNAIIQNNDAGFGGGIAAEGCDLTVRDSEISDNTSGWAGGLAFYGGTLTIESSSISDNFSSGDIGGVWVEDYTGDGAVAVMEDVALEGNEAASYVGALAGRAADITIRGVADGASITNNVDSLTALYLDSGATLSLDSVDMGSADSGTANSSHDIYSTYPYYYGGETTVECDGEGCGEQYDSVIGSAGSLVDRESGARGNVWLADAPGTIESFGFYTRTRDGSGCDVEFMVLSAASTSDKVWTIEAASATFVSATTEGWLDSGFLGVALELDRYYAAVMVFDCSAYGDEFFYRYTEDGAVSGDAGTGTTVGRWLVSDYAAWIKGRTASTVTSDPSSYQPGFDDLDFRYYTSVTWSH